jgi:ABC-type uncharacterized transport system substrate-binding protein
MERREFITLLGGATGWPLAARAQPRALPVIGSLHPASLKGFERHMDAFRQGLREAGYVEGQQVLIDYRWAEGALGRLPSMMLDLIKARVAVIVAWGTAARTARDVRTTGNGADIPIVFAFAGDAVALGLVASYNRPGGNITGVTSIATELQPKRLGLLRELLPNAKTVGLLSNPGSTSASIERKELEMAAQGAGLTLHVFHASVVDDFAPIFAALERDKIDVLIIGIDTFYFGQMDRLASLARRHSIPTMGPVREFAQAGGLVSFGSNIPEAYRLTGVYTGRVLSGAKPADLPVLQPTKFELVINLETAKQLGLTVPLTLQTTADEVIE